MKKLYPILLALLLMVCSAQTAYADAVVGPFEIVMEYGFPVFLIAVAIIVIVLIVRNVRKNKKNNDKKDPEK